jgi:tRNA threonylcarbamoyladenosine biosynthesis protein TsaE
LPDSVEKPIRPIFLCHRRKIVTYLPDRGLMILVRLFEFSNGIPSMGILMKVLQIHSELEMLQLGRRLGERLQTGDLLFLSGDLGAGKTTLTKGIAQGLSISEPITSPTFQIQKSYQGRLRLNHFDLYRLNNPAEIDPIDLEEYLEDGITVIEWGDLLINRQCPVYLEIKIEYTREGNERVVSFNPTGLRYQSLIAGLTEC